MYCVCVLSVLHLRTYVLTYVHTISFIALHAPLCQLKSIAKRTMREADKDKDDKISLEEFKLVSCV